MWTYISQPGCWLFVIGSLVITLLSMPLVIRFAQMVGAIDRGGYRRINERDTPRLGGLAIVLPILLVCLFGILQPMSLFSEFEGTHQKDLMLLLFGGAIIAIMGAINDTREISVKHRFIIQIFVALLVCFSGKTLRVISLPVMGTIDLGAFGGLVLTVLWVVGVINAFNLVDGVDGLAAGLAFFSAAGLGGLALLNEQTEVVLVCLCLMGSLAAFLVYNSHPAKVFLGDTGSLFLGYILATLSLMGSARKTGAVAMLPPILLLGYPIFDTFASIVRRFLRGRSPFVGDSSHTHHRLLDRGFSQRQVALILYGVALPCSVSAILTQTLYPEHKFPLIAVALFATVIVTISWFCGYFRLRSLMLMSQSRMRNNLLKSYCQFAALSIKTDSSPNHLEQVLTIGCRVMRLGFLEIGLSESRNEDPSETILSIDIPPHGPDRTDEDEREPVRSIELEDTAGHWLTIRFQFARRIKRSMLQNPEHQLANIFEREDVEASLAQLFGSIEFGPQYTKNTTQFIAPEWNFSEF